MGTMIRRAIAVSAVLAISVACAPTDGEEKPVKDTAQVAPADNDRSSEPADDVSTEPESEPEMSSVPDLTRTSIEDAQSQLDEAGLEVEVVSKPSWKTVGTVLRQEVPAGRQVSPGTVVTLVVASAMPKVPGTVGSTGKEALAALRKAGFRVDIRRKTVTSGTTGTVLSQSPRASERAEPGSVVAIVLANVARPVASAPSNCTPGYTPCLPPASDYDCAGGEGDGPKYTGYVRVTGTDPYDLDTDGDGVACEAA